MYSSPYSSLGIAGLFFPQTDEGFILKKRLEEIIYLFAYGVKDLSPLVVVIIFETINVLMTLDASCRLLLLFLSGSTQESMLWRTLR